MSNTTKIESLNLFDELVFLEEQLFPKNNECYLCNKMFNSRNGLKQHHRAIKHKKANVICKLCDKTVMNKLYLLKHTIEEHTLKDKQSDGKFKCYVCKKNYSEIRRHIKGHFGIKKKHKKCEFGGGCSKIPHFNIEGSKVARFCFTHKEPYMIDVKHQTCFVKDCSKRPTFNIEGSKVAKFCLAHKNPDMIDVKSKTCLVKICSKKPTFNIEGSKVAKFCFAHKKPCMINVVSKTCQYGFCKTLPTYNIKGSRVAKFCLAHKKNDMINVKNRKCHHNGCNKQPTYNIKSSKVAKFCSEHKELYMVNVISKTCQYEKCVKIPNYNKKGSKVAKFCLEHKDPSMVDVKHKFCLFNGCLTRSTYNKKGSKIPKYCLTHKEPDMIDVITKMCVSIDCKVRASYGYASYGVKFCSQHKKENTIKNPNKKCENKGCSEIATHGDNTNVRCYYHQKKTDNNFIERICVKCGFLELLDSKNMCRNCVPEHFNSYRMAKQLKVKHFLDANNIKYNFYDKTVDKGVCGKERPDFVLDAATHQIVIEVDENQHSNALYKKCHVPRMINISQSLGMPTVFIRYNPDNYRVDGKLHKPFDNMRLGKLKEWIEHVMKMSIGDIKKVGFLSVVHLFFNEYEVSKTKLETLLPFD